MAFFPYERFTLETRLTSDEIAAALSPFVEPRQLLRNPFARNHKRFQGVVNPDGFKMTRIIHHRNSFLPIVRGRYAPLVNGTLVIITMNMHPFVIVFVALWLSAIGAAAVLALRRWLSVSGAGGAFPFGPPAMFAFGYLLCTLGFKWNARKERRFLVEQLTGRRVP